ncbi:MAG: hypothetical protein HY268_32890 [Deltaproteobacteria bacterium]|nr:hypothetical protein [Deltaproteobacteria bacterium]
MILRSIGVEGWRCFIASVRVGPFSDGLNVLHAPNATGKSTLFEALLRGLLDSHRVTGQEVEALRPWGRSLAPLVTMEFAHGGTDYRLTKRFLDRPSSNLERQENGRFVRLAEGEAADLQVREIVTRNPPGRGLARPENWGLAQVLWAPQGDLALTKLSGDVVSDIREFLGVQISGPGAGHLEEQIEDAYLQIYTPGGKLRAGRDAPAVVRLRDQLQQAIEQRGHALNQQQAFEDATRKVEDLRAQRTQVKRDAEAFAKALTEARSDAESHVALLADKREREGQVESAEIQYGTLKERTEAIKTAKKELKEAGETLVRLQADLPLWTREVEKRETEAAQAKSRLEDVRKGREAVEEARQKADLARRYLDTKVKAEELRQHLQRIRQTEKALTQCRKERSELVAPDTRTLRAIRKAVREREAAQVHLEAALITLEIVPEKAGSLEIVVGEETGTRVLTPGRSTEIKGSPEVVVEVRGIGRLRARGPASSVEELRAERDRAARKLSELTRGFGTMDLEELESLSEKARDLDKKVAEAKTQVSTLLSNDSVEKIGQEYARMTASLEEVLASHPEWREAPPDLSGLLASADEIRRSFITAVDETEAAWESAQNAFTAANRKKDELDVRLGETERQQRSLETKIADLSSDGKTHEEREVELKKLALAWDAATAALEAVERKLQTFGEDPRAAVTKLEKQLQSAEEEATKALEAEKSEEGRLGYLSAQGPYSALVQAEEEIATLREEVAREELRTNAVRLLRDTVTQCRVEALSAVVGPVQLAATRMLQRIAGGRLGSIQLGETFEPAHVLPQLAEIPVRLDDVSGGEREQIYLATRLALAEVLAKAERQLVVLDDVLTATDIGRLARILTVLEEAAQRLQVLIITCHPERYRGLDGAQFFDLEAILHDSATA